LIVLELFLYVNSVPYLSGLAFAGSGQGRPYQRQQLKTLGKAIAYVARGAPYRPSELRLRWVIQSPCAVTVAEVDMLTVAEVDMPSVAGQEGHCRCAKVIVMVIGNKLSFQT
jgi:hypothetical protein